jgi:hypothetical protein
MLRLHRNRIASDLLKQELVRAQEEGDLWLQLRCMQELGWFSEASELLVSHRAEIEAGNHLLLRRELARALEDEDAIMDAEKAIARAGISAYFTFVDDDTGAEIEPGDA